MGYIMDLRKKVGHDLLLMPGAGVFIYRDGKLLLQRRRDNGLWADHGGSLEPGETVEDTARRELWEETGLRAGKLELIGIFSGPDMNYTYPNGDQVSILGIYYLCREFEGEPRPQTEEVAELRWFPLEAIPADFHRVVRKPLEACIRKIRQEEKAEAVSFQEKL